MRTTPWKGQYIFPMLTLPYLLSSSDNVHDIVLIDYCDSGVLWDPVLSVYAYQLDTESYTMSPLSLPGSDESPPAGVDSFIHFKGIWGDEQFPDSNPNQETVPYFGLKRFVSGPTGPIMKSLIRKDIGPGPRTKTWVEWAVQNLMGWYPCCIRGWRKWISLIVLVLLLVMFGLGVRYLVMKRFRRKEYARLDAEIPLEDLVSESTSSSRRMSNADHRD